MFYTIYQLTDSINGKIYIGKHKTNDLDDGYMGSGTIIRRIINKRGQKSFKKKILFVFFDENSMNEKEREIITEDFCLRNDNYNLCVGGKGGWSYINLKGKNLYGKNGQPGYGGENLKLGQNHYFTEEEKKRISKTLKDGYSSGRIKSSFLGSKHTEETKRKIGEINSKHQKGSGNSQYGSMWITNGKENKKIKTVDNIPEGWYNGRILEGSGKVPKRT